MKFSRMDFGLINISNVPSNKDKLLNLIKLFKDDNLSLQEMYGLDFHYQLNLNSETFRKMINHSTLIGILDYQDQRYQLSKETKELLVGNYGLNEYFFKLLSKKEPIFNLVEIIIALLQLFSNSMKNKTIYSIFSLIGKQRIDESAIASVGRNLRALFSVLEMSGAVEKNKDKCILKKTDSNYFLVNEIKSLDEYFTDDVINVNLISKYLSNFFAREIVPEILTCVSTYEQNDYVWTRSSLYKDQGEIQNLYGEYIMTVILKRSNTI